MQYFPVGSLGFLDTRCPGAAWASHQSRIVSRRVPGICGSPLKSFVQFSPEVFSMTHAVQILAVSDDAELCNLIQTTLDLEGHQALCVPSSTQALELLNRGVTAEIVLLDAA